MTTGSKSSIMGRRAGHGAGRVWQWFGRLEGRAANRLVERGLSVSVAKALVRVANLAILGVLMYVTFWLTLIGMLLIFAAWIVRNTEHDAAQSGWAIGEQTDHKKNPFYDPINYTDTPDPRFDDEYK